MHQDARRRLEDLLDREIDAARLLSTALAAERSALTGDSPDAVRQQAGEKIRLLQTLEGLEHERGKLCAAAGLGAASEFGAAPDSSGITHRWRALMAVIGGCRTANEVNGYIINVRQHQIRQLIDIVRGPPPGIYGPHGKTFAKSLRALAQA